jgi:hypothetical protein
LVSVILPEGIPREMAAQRIAHVFAGLIRALPCPGTMIASGGETLRAIIIYNPEMPTHQTWWDWLRENPTLSLAVARAREAQAGVFVDEPTFRRHAAAHGLPG